MAEKSFQTTIRSPNGVFDQLQGRFGIPDSAVADFLGQDGASPTTEFQELEKAFKVKIRIGRRRFEGKRMVTIKSNTKDSSSADGNAEVFQACREKVSCIR